MRVFLRPLLALLLNALLLCTAARADALPGLSLDPNALQPVPVHHSRLLEDRDARLSAAQAEIAVADHQRQVHHVGSG